MNSELPTSNSSISPNSALIKKIKPLLKILGLSFLTFLAIVCISLVDGTPASAEKSTATTAASATSNETRPKMKVDEMYLNYNDYIQYVGQISCPMDKNGNTVSQGSGYIVNTNGDFVTNYHVVDGMYGDTCIIGFSSDYRKAPNELYIAKLTSRYDKDVDYMVLKIEKMFKPIEKDTSNIKFEYMPTCDSDIVRLGDPIVVLGYPGYGGDTITATDGIISGSWDNFFKINARINHGNSGGPVLLDDPQYGCSIGLANWSYTDDSGKGDVMNYAIKTEDIKL